MDEKTVDKKKFEAKGLVRPALFVLVLVAYFSAEGLLRRLIYEMPQEKGENTDELIKTLPDFLQGYLSAYTKRLKLRERLTLATSPEERADILYELADVGKGEAVNLKIMMH